MFFSNVDDDDDEGGVTTIVEDSKAPLRFLKFPDQSEEDEAELREKSVRLSDGQHDFRPFVCRGVSQLTPGRKSPN